jgi:hypothetical protein
LLLTNTSGGAINFTTQIGDTVTNAFTQGTRFAKGADSCQNTVVAAGSSCTIVVTFNQNNLTTHPARLGTLTVRDNAPGNPQIVNLTGN